MRPGTDVTAIVTEALRGIAERPDVIATIDRRTVEASAVAAHFGCAVRTFTAEELAAQPVPAPSELAAAAVGTPSVAEAAALLAAGPGARLLIGKHAAGSATVAVALS
jgi:cobalt-precorrin 5A hydrolase